MAAEKAEKKSKKDKKEKKSKLTEDGVTKSKSDKKEKKKKSKEVGDALVSQLDDSSAGTAVGMANSAGEGDEMEVDATPVPIGALVPFANPLADEKQTKKVLKTVKKCKRSRN
jgi:H/ACA ribonucleoprotein complex subunit 2